MKDEIRRFLGFGEESGKVLAQMSLLSPEDTARLLRVANRVAMTEVIRYEVRLSSWPLDRSNEARFHIRSMEFASTEVYLLCTCLDTLAGPASYKSLVEWLSDKNPHESFAIDRLRELDKVYQEVFGLTRNIKKLFLNLPQTTSDWLQANIKFESLTEDDYSLGDTTAFMSELFSYFMDQRRHTFTHSAETKRVHQASLIELSARDDFWTTASYSPKTKKKHNRMFSLRQGIDEATVLKVIIHSAVVRLLGIEVSETILSAFLENLVRKDSLWCFCDEVQTNAGVIEYWAASTTKNSDDYFHVLVAKGLPSLGSMMTVRQLQKFWDNPLESGLKKMAESYKDLIDQGNQRIESFNEAYQVKAKERPTADKKAMLVGFMTSAATETPFDEIRSWGMKREMRNVGLVLRDPSYA